MKAETEILIKRAAADLDPRFPACRRRFSIAWARAPVI
jgi:hypothetical protein